MKPIPTLLSLLIPTFLALAAWSAPAAFEEALFDVEGMTCASCAESITATLSKLEGVREASTDFEKALTRVTYDPARLSTEQLAAAVNELGFVASLRPDDATPDDATPGEITAAGTSCALSEAPAETPAASTLTPAELERVASYLFTEILATGRTGFEDEEIEQATGVVLGDADGPAVRQEVIAKLQASPAGRQLLSGGTSRCQAYEACSLYGDLSGASGEVLAMYEREKAEDGRVYGDFQLPEFTAQDLDGREVSSAELRGQSVLVAFVAVHCQHSMDSLPILQRLTESYGPDGLRVVAVAINSGEVSDVNTWFPSFEPKYDVWVSSGDALGEAIGSHLVPTYLLVNSDGWVEEKLVGYKEPVAVTERLLARLSNDAGPPSEATALK